MYRFPSPPQSASSLFPRLEVGFGSLFGTPNRLTATKWIQGRKRVLAVYSSIQNGYGFSAPPAIQHVARPLNIWATGAGSHHFRNWSLAPLLHYLCSNLARACPTLR